MPKEEKQKQSKSPLIKNKNMQNMMKTKKMMKMKKVQVKSTRWMTLLNLKKRIWQKAKGTTKRRLTSKRRTGLSEMDASSENNREYRREGRCFENG